MGKPSPANSEWLTRKTLIDKGLGAANWRVTPHKEGVPLSRLDRCAVEEYPTASGPADYALVLGGRVVGVVEAKKLSLGRRMCCRRRSGTAAASTVVRGVISAFRSCTRRMAR